MLGFSLQSDTGSAAQTVIAALVGVGFVVALRVLLKFRDPSDVTRDLGGHVDADRPRLRAGFRDVDAGSAGALAR